MWLHAPAADIDKQLGRDISDSQRHHKSREMNYKVSIVKFAKNVVFVSRTSRLARAGEISMQAQGEFSLQKNEMDLIFDTDAEFLF